MRLTVAAGAALTLMAMPALAHKASEDNSVEILLDCGPKTYDEALACLDKGLVPENKAELASGERMGVRHGIASLVRLAWMAPGPLRASLEALGVTDPDAQANLVLDGYAARLHGEPFDPALKAAAYRTGSLGHHSGDNQ